MKKSKSVQSNLPTGILCIAYIPVLFLITMNYAKKISEGRDKNILEMHIKQGVALSFFGIFVFLMDNLNAFLFLNILGLPVFIGIGYAIAIMWILWLSLMAKGIINILKNEHKPLPVIGRFFYRGDL